MKSDSTPGSRHGRARHYVVALTGGAAAGKSAIARRFEALGVGVYDADDAAREVVAPGSAALVQIEFVFGPETLNADGSLNRRVMRERAFADPGARRRLEAIVHPRVRTWLKRRVGMDRGAYCILVIPLLAENHDDYGWVDRVLLVDGPEDLRIKRLMRRDRVSRAHAQQMLAAQATPGERRAIADDVLVNDGEESALDAQVEVLHARYLALATA